LGGGIIEKCRKRASRVADGARTKKVSGDKKKQWGLCCAQSRTVLGPDSPVVKGG